VYHKTNVYSNLAFNQGATDDCCIMKSAVRDTVSNSAVPISIIELKYSKTATMLSKMFFVFVNHPFRISP
jgi:hypothetical protein